MHLSKKSEYAIRALLAMSRHAMGRIHTLQELSAREGIPPKFLEQILAQLKKAGILNSRRGSQGGYALARPPSQILLGEILDLIEGSKASPPADISAQGKGRTLAILRTFQREMDRKIHDLIHQRTFEDLLKFDPQKSPMNFEI